MIIPDNMFIQFVIVAVHYRSYQPHLSLTGRTHIHTHTSHTSHTPPRTSRTPRTMATQDI